MCERALAAPTPSSSRPTPMLEPTLPPSNGAPPDGDPTPRTLAPGTRLRGTNYVVVRKLGAGGMGVVYAVRDVVTSRHYALKMIHRVYAREREFVGRFRLEVTALHRLTGHPNIVRIVEVGKTARGHLFYVMELLDGVTLHKLLRDVSATLPLRQSLTTVLDVLAGVGAAHALGVFHRDIKPHNVFVTQGGPAKIIDFGIAAAAFKVVGKDPTKPGVYLGTPSYTAPEILAGTRATAQSDLYSIGVVLWEALTGQPPFLEGDVLRTLATIATRGVPSLEEVGFGALPEFLRVTVRRATSSDPRQRHGSVEALADDLRAILHALPPDEAPSLAELVATSRGAEEGGRGRAPADADEGRTRRDSRPPAMTFLTVNLYAPAPSGEGVVDDDEGAPDDDGEGEADDDGAVKEGRAGASDDERAAHDGGAGAADGGEGDAAQALLATTERARAPEAEPAEVVVRPEGWADFFRDEEPPGAASLPPLYPMADPPSAASVEVRSSAAPSTSARSALEVEGGTIIGQISDYDREVIRRLAQGEGAKAWQNAKAGYEVTLRSEGGVPARTITPERVRGLRQREEDVPAPGVSPERLRELRRVAYGRDDPGQGGRVGYRREEWGGHGGSVREGRDARGVPGQGGHDERSGPGQEGGHDERGGPGQGGRAPTAAAPAAEAARPPTMGDAHVRAVSSPQLSWGPSSSAESAPRPHPPGWGAGGGVVGAPHPHPPGWGPSDGAESAPRPRRQVGGVVGLWGWSLRWLDRASATPRNIAITLGLGALIYGGLISVFFYDGASFRSRAAPSPSLGPSAVSASKRPRAPLAASAPVPPRTASPASAPVPSVAAPSAGALPSSFGPAAGRKEHRGTEP
jgi:serine/threonine protein kinase